MSPPKKTTPSAPPLRGGGRRVAMPGGADDAGVNPPRSLALAAPPQGGGKESGDERIAKRMARAGLCSRREAEVWVREGRVKVNGKKLVDPAFNVSDKDAIMVDGKLLAAKERTRMWLYHKPRGLVTTHKDPEGRPTVFGALPKELGRVISVGRLDANSEGLLLLTNDGELARRLELPSQGWVRRYRIRIFGKPENLEKLQQGITIDGMRYGSIKAVVDSEKDSNCWLTVSLQEGKNRELRKVFEHLGHPVSRLIRLAYGPFQLSTIERGTVKEVTQKVIKEQLGG
jgi:23S rRNA pseudouridine2605 synthase